MKTDMPVIKKQNVMHEIDRPIKQKPMSIQKQVKYSLLSGEFLFEKGKNSSKLKTFIKFPFDFFRVYFLQRNFLNGYQGFIWSMLASFGSFIKYAKLDDLHQDKEV